MGGVWSSVTAAMAVHSSPVARPTSAGDVVFAKLPADGRQHACVARQQPRRAQRKHCHVGDLAATLGQQAHAPAALIDRQRTHAPGMTSKTQAAAPLDSTTKGSPLPRAGRARGTSKERLWRPSCDRMACSVLTCVRQGRGSCVLAGTVAWRRLPAARPHRAALCQPPLPFCCRCYKFSARSGCRLPW